MQQVDKGRCPNCDEWIRYNDWDFMELDLTQTRKGTKMVSSNTMAVVCPHCSVILGTAAAGEDQIKPGES